MTHWLRYYTAQLSTDLALEFQYRVSSFIWLIGMIVEPVMYLVVWQTVAGAQGGSVGSFTVGDFAAYYILLMLVNHLTFTWIMWEYERYIREGELSTYLLRPIHPIHKDIAANIAYKIMTLAGLLPVALILVWALRPTFTVVPWALIAFVPALAIAAGLRFVSGWTLALAAFWTTRTNAVNQAYFVALLFFSGRLAPMELFPRWVQILADILPFKWMVAFPVELAMGRLTVQETLIGFGAQAIWVGISWLGMIWVWRAGIKTYSAVGA